MTHAHTVVVPLCLLVLAGAWFVLGRTAAAPSQAAAPDGKATTPAPEGTPATREAATPPAEAATGAASAAPQAVFPDGSTWPLLNGVTEQVTMPWPDRPFSPVVDRVLDNGQEWYRHQDGTWTTTVIRPETVSGKNVAMGLVFSPKPAVPSRLRESPTATPAQR